MSSIYYDRHVQSPSKIPERIDTICSKLPLTLHSYIENLFTDIQNGSRLLTK